MSGIGLESLFNHNPLQDNCSIGNAYHECAVATLGFGDQHLRCNNWNATPSETRKLFLRHSSEIVLRERYRLTRLDAEPLRTVFVYDTNRIGTP